MIQQGGSRSVQQGGSRSVQQGGSRSVQQGGSRSVQQGGSRSVQQGGSRSVQQGGSHGQFHRYDDIHFWGRQMAEHMELLCLGFEDAELKEGAHKLHTEWIACMDPLFNGISHDKIFLDQADIAKISPIDINQIIKMIDCTNEYLQNAIKVIKTKGWVGWIFISLVQHMIVETLYFKQQLTEPLSIDAECKIILEHHVTESAATAHLLDPAEKVYIEEAERFVQKYSVCMTRSDHDILDTQPITDQAAFICISLKYSEDLVNFATDLGSKIQAKKVYSLISPALANHIEREYIRFTARLQFLREQVR